MPIDYNDTGIVTGAIANITDGADEVPIIRWGVNIDPTLSGKSQIVATQAKKNLLAKEIVRYTNSMADLTECFAIHHGTYTVTIGTVEDATNWRLSVLLMDANGNALTDNTYKPNNDLQLATNRWRYGSNTTTKSFTVNIVVDCYVRFFIELGDTSSSTTISNSFLEVGSTATSYEPYSAPVDKTVNLGRTIHGGSADVVNGTGTETYINKDMGELSWTRVQYQTSGIYAFRYISTDKKNGAFNLMAEGYTLATIGHGWGVNMEDMTIVGQTGTGYVFIRDDRYTTEEDFIEAVNHKMMSYELLAPTDFTFPPITPTPETALGTNNFWADEGDSELTYYKDGYGYTSVTVHKETPEGEPVEETRKFHRIIYEGQVDVISGTGLINIGESGTEYDPPEQISFTPIEIATDEGENTFYADEGVSVITYRMEVE